jgi:hypothetical protein
MIVLLGRTNVYPLHHHVREGVLLCPYPALVGWYSQSPVTSLYLTVSVGKALVSLCLQLTHIPAQTKRRPYNYIYTSDASSDVLPDDDLSNNSVPNPS